MAIRGLESIISDWANESATRLTVPLLQSGAVFASINRIATQVACIPLKLVRVKGKTSSVRRKKILDVYFSDIAKPLEAKKDDFNQKSSSGPIEEVEDHWLLDLFCEPNPEMVQYNFMLNTITRMLHDGSVFWIKNGKGDRPNKLWIKPQSMFKPIVEKGRIVKWLYDGGELGTDKVCRLFLLQHPNDESAALSPLESIRSELQQGFYAALYNEAFFKNGGTPGDVYTTEQELNDEQRQSMVESIKSRYTGPGRSHRPLLLDGGVKREAANSHRDMEFSEQQNWVTEVVMKAFGTNSAIIGGSASATTNGKFYEAKIAFFEICVVPLLRYLSEQVRKDFLSKSGQRGDSDLVVVYDLAKVDGLRGSVVDTSEAAKNFLSSGFSRNEVNKRFDLGFEDTDWGDEALGNGALRACSKLTEAEVMPGDKTPAQDTSPQNANPDGNTVAASLKEINQTIVKQLMSEYDQETPTVDLSKRLNEEQIANVLETFNHLKTSSVSAEIAEIAMFSVVEAALCKTYNEAKVEQGYETIYSGLCLLHRQTHLFESTKAKGCKCLLI